MFINNKEQIVFSIFNTDNLDEIKLFLDENQKNNCKSFYKKLDIENDIVPERGGAHFPKVVFFKPVSACVTVQYSNYYDGWFTLSNYISEKIQKPFYLISFSNETSNDQCFLFSLYQNGAVKRMVRAMQDPKWIFYNDGTVLPFENEDYYKKRRINDRLNKDIIIEYCRKLKLDITNDDFWKSSEPALFYEYTGWENRLARGENYQIK